MEGFIEMDRFIVQKYSERVPDIFKIYNTIAEEYVKIGKDYLVCSSKEEAQEVCDILNKVIAFC